MNVAFLGLKEEEQEAFLCLPLRLRGQPIDLELNPARTESLWRFLNSLADMVTPAASSLVCADAAACSSSSIRDSILKAARSLTIFQTQVTTTTAPSMTREASKVAWMAKLSSSSSFSSCMVQHLS